MTNGLEGRTKSGYLVLWSVPDLIALSEAYHVKEFIPHIIVIGSDGAELAFGFDTSYACPPIVKLPLIGMGHVPYRKIADTFEAFLSYQITKRNFFNFSGIFLL